PPHAAPRLIYHPSLPHRRYHHALKHLSLFPLFFFLAPPPTALYPLSLHDALPISPDRAAATCRRCAATRACSCRAPAACSFVSRSEDTRLNSSHRTISYAVFCLKKKKQKDK